MVWEDLKPTDILTEASFRNAITVAMAMVCSTNAIIHLIAMAGRAGCAIGLEDFEAASRAVPVVANVRPSGTTYLMEDFYFAGGLPGLMTRICEHLDLEALTVNGWPLGDNLQDAAVGNDDVIRTADNPIYTEGSLAVLKGNLAPDGCAMKASTCDPRFLKHRGPALVFDDHAALKENIDRDDLDVTPDHWPIELHKGDVPRVGWLLDDYYEVPYDCFVPLTGDNLLTAGRCLSAEHEAMASARVTAQCFAYGQAIGHAAAYALREKCQPRDIPGATIRQILNADGARLD